MIPSTSRESEQDGPFFRLQTGIAGCQALFQPGRYLLNLITGDDCKRVELGYSGSRLLERLLQEPGEVISRDELLRYAWTERVVGQGSLNQQVYTLRQLLGDEQNRNIIQTLPRRGYLINPGALIQIEDSSANANQPAAPTPSQPNRKFRLRWPVALVTAVTLLLSGHLVSGKTNDLQVYGSLGHLSILYVAQTQKQLSQLQQAAEPAVASLAELADHPTVVTVSSTGEFVQMLCRGHSSRQAHWLEVHQSRLNAVPDQDLRSCLL